MTTPINPVAGTSFPVQLVGPADGESANALSVNSVFQSVENGMEAARLLLYGGGIRRRVKCTSNTNLVIQPLGAVLVTVAGVWTTLAHTSSSTVSPVTITGGLVANTRYWVYAYNNAGTVDFVANTTAPDVGLRYENANTTRLYVSTFATDVGGNVLLYNQDDNKYIYVVNSAPGGGVDGNLIVDTTNGPATTTVTLTTRAIPSGCSEVLLYLSIQGTAAAVATVVNPTTAQVVWVYESSATSVSSGHHVPYALSAANNVTITVAANGVLDQANVKGFTY